MDATNMQVLETTYELQEFQCARQEERRKFSLGRWRNEGGHTCIFVHTQDTHHLSSVISSTGAGSTFLLEELNLSEISTEC